MRARGLVLAMILLVGVSTGSVAAAPPAQLPEVAGPRSMTIAKWSTNARVIHLSFDAGADRGYAESILDTLLAEGIPASFGMTGQWAQANPDLIGRMAGEGHRLINH